MMEALIIFDRPPDTSYRSHHWYPNNRNSLLGLGFDGRNGMETQHSIWPYIIDIVPKNSQTNIKYTVHS